MIVKTGFPKNYEVYALFLHQDSKRPEETEIYTVLFCSARPSPSAAHLVLSCHRTAGVLSTPALRLRGKKAPM